MGTGNPWYGLPFYYQNLRSVEVVDLADVTAPLFLNFFLTHGENNFEVDQHQALSGWCSLAR